MREDSIFMVNVELYFILIATKKTSENTLIREDSIQTKKTPENSFLMYVSFSKKKKENFTANAALNMTYHLL